MENEPIKINDRFAIWTDGSFDKKTNTAGFAVWYNTNRYVKQRTNDDQSVFQSELEAIESALKTSQGLDKITIFTDSMSAIELINKITAGKITKNTYEANITQSSSA